MAANGGNNKALSIPLATILTIIGMAIGGVTTFYGVRDQAVSAARAEIQAGVVQLRQEQREALEHYVTREDWAIWKEQNRARSDQQFYDLQGAIQRIGARISR